MSQGINPDGCSWDTSKKPPPIGDELRAFLHAWLKLAEKAHDEKQCFPTDINWAIRKRAAEVLEWLDASTNPLDYEVAKAIRRIGTMDSGSFGYISGMWAYGRYGILAAELGNKTWIPSNNKRKSNIGDAAQEYFQRYGEEPYFV
jgi:hypothetical protein